MKCLYDIYMKRWKRKNGIFIDIHRPEGKHNLHLRPKQRHPLSFPELFASRNRGIAAESEWRAKILNWTILSCPDK